MTLVEHNPALLPPGVVAPSGTPATAPGPAGSHSGPVFADVLRTQPGQPVRFSSHALQRA
jgi:hypothetical protein